MNCKTCGGRGKIQSGLAGEYLEDCPDCSNPMTTQTKHTPLEWFAIGSPDDTDIDGTAEIRAEDES